MRRSIKLKKTMKQAAIAFTLFCLAICSGCAHKVYGKTQSKGIVDSETKILNSESKTNIEINYDNSIHLTANIKNTEVRKVQKRYKKEYERCWRIKHGSGSPFDIIEIPFAILEAFLESGPKPGCHDWTKWTSWEDSSKPDYRSVSYNGKVSFNANTNHFNIVPSSAETVRGRTEAVLEFRYPYLSTKECRNIHEKHTEKAIITVNANNKSNRKEITYYNVSRHLNSLLFKYFNVSEFSILDKNSRFPIENARVTIEMFSGFDIDSYLAKIKISVKEKEYLSTYLRKQYGGILPNSNFIVRTNNDGKCKIIIPSKSMNIAKKISISHRQYYYRELSNIELSRNIKVESNVPNTIFLNDIGSKIRKEDVQKSY